MRADYRRKNAVVNPVKKALLPQMQFFHILECLSKNKRDAIFMSLRFLTLPVIVLSLALVAGCNGGGGGGGGGSGGGNGGEDTGNDNETVSEDPIPPSAPFVPDENLSLAEQVMQSFFVTSFDSEAVEEIRNLPAFQGSRVDAEVTIANHPTYRNGVIVNYHPFEATRLHYALSTGLTGEGQVLSVVDDGVLLTHEQFAGKNITVSGEGVETFHGTPVAAVMVGSGNGDGIGYATGADLHVGRFDYNVPLEWDAMAELMNDAAELGAIASNNSWGLNNLTVASGNAQQIVNAMEPYIEALEDFSETGIIVFAVQNEYFAQNVELMAGLPEFVPELESSWLAVINAIPEFDDDGIISAERISAPCLEAARYCLAAPGLVRAAEESADDSYGFFSGASFAAPQVAGSLALLAEAFPHLPPEGLRARLIVTADNSFFDHDDEVDFGSGLVHGYNSEFGHGFIDLRAALLPIGEIGMPQSSGQRIPIDRPALISGGAAGDALVSSLAKTDLIAVDDMQGAFQFNGAALGAAQLWNMPVLDRQVSQRSLRDERMARRGDGRNDRSMARLLGRDRIAGLTESTDMAIPVSDHLDVSFTHADGGVSGMGMRAHTQNALGRFSLGYTMRASTGSVLGITVPGHEDRTRSRSHEVNLGWNKRFGDMDLGLEASWGMTNANGVGFVKDFGNLRHDSVGIRVGFNDFINQDDNLTLFARRPLAFTSGFAMIEVPHAMTAQGIQYRDRKIAVTPSSREISFGFEYMSPVFNNSDFLLSAAFTQNSGHIKSQNNFEFMVGLQSQF